MNDHEKEIQLSTIREYKIVKANDLIQKTRHNLSTQEQKIILYLITIRIFSLLMNPGHFS